MYQLNLKFSRNIKTKLYFLFLIKVHWQASFNIIFVTVQCRKQIVLSPISHAMAQRINSTFCQFWLKNAFFTNKKEQALHDTLSHLIIIIITTLLWRLHHSCLASQTEYRGPGKDPMQFDHNKSSFEDTQWQNTFIRLKYSTRISVVLDFKNNNN